MFKVGDIIIYDQHGACLVEEIVEKTTPSGEERTYYALVPKFRKYSRIFCPIDNTKVKMRHAISKAAANKLIDSMPSIKEPYKKIPDMKQLEKYYGELLATQIPEDLVRITSFIHEKKQACEKMNKKLGSIDVRARDKAEDLLFGELAVALGIERGEVQDYISKRLEKTSS